MPWEARVYGDGVSQVGVGVRRRSGGETAWVAQERRRGWRRRDGVGSGFLGLGRGLGRSLFTGFFFFFGIGRWGTFELLLLSES